MARWSRSRRRWSWRPAAGLPAGSGRCRQRRSPFEAVSRTAREWPGVVRRAGRCSGAVVLRRQFRWRQNGVDERKRANGDAGLEEGRSACRCRRTEYCRIVGSTSAGSEIKHGNDRYSAQYLAAVTIPTLRQHMELHDVAVVDTTITPLCARDVATVDRADCRQPSTRRIARQLALFAAYIQHAALREAAIDDDSGFHGWKR